MVQLRENTKRFSAASQALKSVTSRIENDSTKLLINTNSLKVRPAFDKEDYQNVFQLAYDVYLKKGYAFHHETKLETSSYDAHKDTLVLMVENEFKEVVGSLTLYFDDGKLLPADSIFNQELNSLRNQGIKFVEVSRFVIKDNYQYQKELLLSLINVIYIHAFRVMKYDEFIIEVNPRHVDYYRKLLGFEQYGAVKECPRVNNAPAVLLRCNKEKYLKAVEKNEFEKRSLYNHFMTRKNEESVVANLIAKSSMSLAIQKYFGLI